MTHPHPKGRGSHCPHYQHGHKLFQHGDLAAARDALLRSVDDDFDNAEAWGLLARVYAEMDELEHAAEAACQAVRSEPDNAEWHVLKGAQVFAINKADEALESYGKALTLDPNHGLAYFSRAFLYAETGKKAEALADLARAVEVEPGTYDLISHVEALEALRDEKGFPKAPSPPPQNNPFGGLGK